MNDPLTARSAIESAAEAVRTFNHLTLAAPAARTPGWEGLADVYAITAELQVLTQRLPQAFNQVAAAFDDPAVVYASDNDDHPANVIVAVQTGLIDAARFAEALRVALDRAQSAISHLYVTGHADISEPRTSS